MVGKGGGSRGLSCTVKSCRMVLRRSVACRCVGRDGKGGAVLSRRVEARTVGTRMSDVGLRDGLSSRPVWD